MPIDWKKYPHNWKDITARVKKRANGKCELCRAAHGSPHPITGSMVLLTTHHINFNVENNFAYNLLCLCQRCHLRLDMANRIDSRHVNDNPLRLNWKIGSKLYFVLNRKIETRYIEKIRIVIDRFQSCIEILTKDFATYPEDINNIPDDITVFTLICFDDLDLAKKIQYRLGETSWL